MNRSSIATLLALMPAVRAESATMRAGHKG